MPAAPGSPRPPHLCRLPLRLELLRQPRVLRLQALRSGLGLRQPPLQVQDGVGGLAPLRVERLRLALQLLAEGGSQGPDMRATGQEV